jgi:hypothetical protein
MIKKLSCYPVKSLRLPEHAAPTGVRQARIHLHADGVLSAEGWAAVLRSGGRPERHEEHISMKNTATENTDDTDWTDFHG